MWSLFNLRFFFQMAISLLTYVATFSGQLIFGETTSSHVFRVTISSQQLLFWSSYSSELLLFWGTSIFRTVVIFFRMATLIVPFQSKTSTEQPILKNRVFFRASTFLKTDFLVENTAWIMLEYRFTESSLFCNY